MSYSNPKKRINTPSSSSRKPAGNSTGRPASKRTGFKKADGYKDKDRGDKKSFTRSTDSSATRSSYRTPGKKTSDGNFGDRKRPYTSKASGGRSEEGGERKRSYGSKPPYKTGEKDFASDSKRSYGSKPAYKTGRPSRDGDDKKSYGSKPAYKTARPTRDGDNKKSYGSKPAYNTGRPSRDGDDKRSYGSKPAYKTARPSKDGDDKKSYGSKPAYKTSRPLTEGDEKKAYTEKRAFKRSDSIDNKKVGSKPPYKTAGGRTVYDKRKPEDGTDYKGKGTSTRGKYTASERNTGTFDDKPKVYRSKPDGAMERTGNTRKAATERGAFKRTDAGGEGAEKKKAYGSADTFTARSAIKSITDKDEKPAVRKSFKEKDNFDKGTTFTKKSEMKGYKPRIKEGEKEQDFRFAGAGAKGKSIKVEAVDAFVSKTKSQSKERVTENVLYSGGEIRLNRFISNAGVSSRREADELIGAGLVTINGEVVTELGTKVKAGDTVKFNGQKLAVEAKVYIVLNKPKDAITTSDDPDGRNTVMDLFEGKMKERIFPVGRLDRNTTGVLLLTNDGELANRLMHPKYEINKVYKATLNKNLKSPDLWTLANGVMLEDGMIKPDAIAQSDAKDKNIVGIEIHSGKNRIIHRMFEHIGYTVDKLDRVLYAGMEKGSLKRGEWRELSDKEIKALKRVVHLR